MTFARIVLLVGLGSCSSSATKPPDCTIGFDLHTIARDHKAAWSAAFDGRPLTDRELLALADTQRVLECLEEHAAEVRP
jgi:hypothetical protein